jgi:hypothetical protein
MLAAVLLFPFSFATAAPTPTPTPAPPAVQVELLPPREDGGRRAPSLTVRTIDGEGRAVRVGSEINDWWSLSDAIVKLDLVGPDEQSSRKMDNVVIRRGTPGGLVKLPEHYPSGVYRVTGEAVIRYRSRRGQMAEMEPVTLVPVEWTVGQNIRIELEFPGEPVGRGESGSGKLTIWHNLPASQEAAQFQIEMTGREGRGVPEQWTGLIRQVPATGESPIAVPFFIEVPADVEPSVYGSEITVSLGSVRSNTVPLNLSVTRTAWERYRYVFTLVLVLVVLLILLYVVYRTRPKRLRRLEGDLVLVGVNAEEQLDLDPLRREVVRVGAHGELGAECTVASLEIIGGYSTQARNKTTHVKALTGTIALIREGRQTVVLNGTSELIYDQEQIHLTDPDGSKAVLFFRCPQQPRPAAIEDSREIVMALPHGKP